MRKSCLKGCFCLKAGFTLIELLVVVLIIGILAAVALPQYTKAVEKSRTREAVLTLQSMQKALTLCYLQYSNVAEECGTGENGIFSRMDIEIPGTLVEDDYCESELGCYLTKDWAYDTDGDFYAYRVKDPEDLSKAPYGLRIPRDDNEIICEENVEGACKNICGGNNCMIQ